MNKEQSSHEDLEKDTCGSTKNDEENPRILAPTIRTDGRHETKLPLRKVPHLGSHRQYWRDIILGVNDGLVSTFLLVAGVCGGGLTSTDILLTALAGSLAGAVSMAAGEYVATKSQNEVIMGEIALERQHVDDFRQEEIEEVSDLLTLIGIPPESADIRETLLDFYTHHPASLLKIMVALEFGMIEEEQRSPVKAGLVSCVLFLVGSMPSVVPFIFAKEETIGLVVAAAVTIFALIIVGAVKTWASRGNCCTAAMENLIIAGVGGGLAYGVGGIFDKILH